MRYERPKMEVIDLKEEIMTVLLESGDVPESGGELPEIDMSGEG